MTSKAQAEVTTTIRNIPVEVPLGAREGLSKTCVVNCDNLSVRRQIFEAVSDGITSLFASNGHKQPVGIALE